MLCRFPFLFAAFVFASGFANQNTFAVEPPPAEKFHLYLLIGQSNMAGRGVLESESQPPERVLKFDKDNQWVPATEPLHFDKPKVAGAGIGYSFATTMAAANPDITIGLIPCAVGGTPLSRWQKDGDLYKQAVERAQLAMKSGTLKGILWHQGEGDSGNKALAESYAKRLMGMVQDLREELHSPVVPFVAGELGEFLRTGTDEKPSYWKTVNQQINSIPQTLPHSAAVSSAGLKDKGDHVHFDTAALREFGKRYADAMLTLQSP